MPEKKEQTLELLLEAGRLLSSKLELGELLVTVLGLSAKVVGAETASLLLLDEQTQELYFHTALGLGEEAAHVRLPLGRGIAGCVAQSRLPEIINDVHQDSRWSPKMDEKSGFKTRSILAVPMLLKDRLLGVVEAINKADGDFSDEDLHTLEAFASQAAVAIDNATLFSSLKEERLKLHTVFSEMTDGALLADEAGRIILANQAARKFFTVGTGLSTMSEALASLSVDPPLGELTSGEKPSADFTARRDKPIMLVLAGRATRVKLAQTGGEEALGWLFVVRDESEEAQKLALKRTFLSLISHKLKTPLVSLTGFSEIILEEFTSHPPRAPMLLKAAQTVCTQGRKLADLVDKLLRYTTLESPDTKLDLAPVPLDELVDQARTELKDWLAEKKAEVFFEPSGLVVPCDRRMLCGALKNLIENAAKFADKPEKNVAVQIKERGDQVHISVCDNGPGIPPEEQDRIFSQFHQVEASFTGQIEGWGLGLPFVRKVVSLHGGTVRLASKLGEGTAVTVCLPRTRG